VDGGAAYAHPTCMKADCLVFYRERLSVEGSLAGEGHAVCTCGERGPHGDSYRARRRWHNEHKKAKAAMAVAA